jgi:hypothetical protein
VGKLTSKLGGYVDNTPSSNLTLARQLGKSGEEAVGVAGPKTGIRIPGSNQLRFPDAIDLKASILTEVKNRTGILSYTKQLRDYASYAQQNGLQFELYVRPSTQLTGPLRAAAALGEVIIKHIPGAQ